MSDNQLILFPAAQHPVDGSMLLPLLTKCGLLGEAVDVVGEPRFRTGPRFAEWFAVPATTLSDEVVSISVEHSDKPEIVASALTDSPGCPGCGVLFDDWSELMGQWYEDAEATARCGECDVETSIPGLNWHHGAGFACAFVRIWGVHEDEMTLSPALKAFLEEASGFAWTHIYYRL